MSQPLETENIAATDLQADDQIASYLDPNGNYSHAFGWVKKIKPYRPDNNGDMVCELVLKLWTGHNTCVTTARVNKILKGGMQNARRSK